MSDLRDALSKLDPKNDAHWTGDGLPLMEAVGAGFTRKQVTTAFPNFTRENPVLESPPKAVETLEPKQEATKQSVFGMESSEFGGVSDEDDEEDQVDSPREPTPEEQAEAAKQEADAADLLEQKRAQAEQAKAELEEATRAQDALVARKESMAPPSHLAQQSFLMRYLANTQKQKPEKSQIDKVMERKDGYGRKRPIFFNQNDPTVKK
jgi:flagellar biosynthesis GTPase FlhF